MKKFILFSFLSLTFVSVAQSDSLERVAITQAIDDLFDGMREADTVKVKNVMHSNARLITTFLKYGENEMLEEDLSKFIEAIGRERTDLWDERISNLEVQINQGLAQVWMDYSFYINDELSHCGVNAMQLVKSNGEWKIIHLMDTRKRKGCD